MPATGSIITLLFKILGRRVFLSFGLVTFLIVFLLSAVTVTSRYAMQRYVADQVERLPFDLSVYQTAEVPLAERLSGSIAAVSGIAAAERLYFLRTIPPYAVASVVDGQQLRTPWLSLLMATDPTLLPPDLRPSGNGISLVLVGSKAQMGDALLRLQNRKRFELVAKPRDEHAEADHEHDDNHAHKHPLGIVTVSASIERVIRVDASEINRWFLEKTSSPTLVPELGMILVGSWDPKLILSFDALSRGFMHDHGHADIHGSPGEYFPEVIHLAKLDRANLISGWDIEGSLHRIITTGSRMTDDVQEITASAAVDHNLGVMFLRMSDIAKRIALISLLVSLPLLLMAGILLSNLSALLLLNERRKLGLLRLRGVSGGLIGRTLLLAVGIGGLLGGMAGAVLGTLLPLLIYFGRIPPVELIGKIQEPLYLGLFLVVGLAIALLTGRRFIAEAIRVSPLDALRRTAVSQTGSTQVQAGPLQWLAFALGGLKVIGWIADYSLADISSEPWVADADRALDFIAFPLFIYGLVSLLASSEWLMSAIMRPAAWALAGSLKTASLRHMTTRRHRAASFLLIVALMTSLALYPTVMIAVFDNKTERGARVQLGGHMQVTLNALDLMPAETQAKGDLSERLASLQQRLNPLLAELERMPEVRHATYMVEGLVEGLYMPDRGFSGLPMYLTAEPGRYLGSVYHEPELGQLDSFSTLMHRLGEGKVLSSTSVGTFYKKGLDQPMPVGRTTAGRLERVPFGGAVHFLPGVPLRTVNEREGFISARVDYLNHLFTNSPYLIGDARNRSFADLDVLIPRVVLTITASGNGSAGEFQERVLKTIEIKPLDVHDLNTEIARLGGDMYIYLARQNVQIYLLGGLILALIGIFAVAYANYVEDRRTLALLRIRGAGPLQVVRFFMPNIIGPSVVGFIIGALMALAGGFGITKLVWELRQLQTVLNYLPTHLALSQQTAVIGGILLLAVIGIAVAFGRWVFARTARQSLLEG
ncbi:MAG TPA: hypothetical protein VFK79_06820 [Xanthobacteraceae bacterium]|nr:hypothetical protein [Xanthobacteraceae bacterium]